MTSKKQLTRAAATSRARGLGFRPRGTASYTSKYAIDKGELFVSPEFYGHLNDSTSYAEYAWEFLRRNSFYQRMIDGTGPQDVRLWGYQPTPAHVPHFGVCRAIPYRNRHSDNVHWEPIEQSRLLIQEAIRKTAGIGLANVPIIEVKGPQAAVVFDLSEQFGPDCIGLNRQLDIVNSELERWMTKKQIREQYTKPSKSMLRTYLQVADALSQPQSPKDKKLGTYTRSEMFTVDMMAEQLLPGDGVLHALTGDAWQQEFNRRQDRAYRYTKQAWDYIYKWRNLNLLTFRD